MVIMSDNCAAYVLRRNIRPVLGRLFRWAPLRYCGAISYSLYLWQQLFLVPGTPSWGMFRRLPLSIAVPVLIAAASLYFIETPLLKLKEKIAPQTQ